MYGLKTCQRPECFKGFKGDKGLNIHLGLVRKCSSWYRKHVRKSSRVDLACTPPPDIDNQSDARSQIPSSPSDDILPHTPNTSVTSLESSSSSRFSNFSLGDGLFAKAPPVIAEPASVPWTSVDELKKGDESFFAQLHGRRVSASHLPVGMSFLDELARAVPRSRASGSDEGEDDSLEYEAEDRSQASESEQVGWSPSPIVDKYPGAGRDYGKGRDILQEVDAQDMYAQERAKCLYYPFENEDDFDMAAWLMESGVSMAHIDIFLKLPMASVSSSFPF